MKAIGEYVTLLIIDKAVIFTWDLAPKIQIVEILFFIKKDFFVEKAFFHVIPHL